MEDNRQQRNGGNRQSDQRRRPQRVPSNPREEVRQDRSVEVLLEKLENTVEEARSVPLGTKCMMDREEVLYLVRMIRESLPEELERARWVLQQNHQLINEARREAEAVIRDAEVQMAAMIDEHEVTQQALQAASLMVDEARQQSESIRNNALTYTRDILDNLEEHLTNMLVNIKENQKALE
ncbi:MAG: hypothetical protein PHV73_00150 [Eubacteriales bacterium]|nr:hypothetical protein [Eubacteriales bacterium]